MIESIQEKLQTIYRLPVFPKVRQFLLSPAQAQLFDGSIRDQPRVLFFEENDDANIGIYLGKKIFKNITKNNHVFSLQDFCVVAEEVSHFVYLLWSKCNAKKINLLDLEIQAEVDKFLITKELFPNKETMIQKMFEKITLRKGLTSAQEDRYLIANRLGRKLALDWNSKKMTFEKKMKWLKVFYRQTPNSRISMIERGMQ